MKCPLCENEVCKEDFEFDSDKNKFKKIKDKIAKFKKEKRNHEMF